MKKQDIQFLSFVDQLAKKTGETALCEAVKKGYKACCEAEDRFHSSDSSNKNYRNLYWMRDIGTDDVKSEEYYNLTPMQRRAVRTWTKGREDRYTSDTYLDTDDAISLAKMFTDITTEDIKEMDYIIKCSGVKSPERLYEFYTNHPGIGMTGEDLMLIRQELGDADANDHTAEHSAERDMERWLDDKWAREQEGWN